MRHQLLASAMLAAGLSAVSMQAMALSITPATTPVFTTNQVSALSASQVQSLVGYAGTLSLIYRRNVDNNPAEEGAAAPYYSTVFDLSPTDPSKATLTWGVGGTHVIACPDCYLVIKDGNQTPAQYVFNLGSWNGQETIELSGFWPAQGAISHVAIFSSGTLAPVPEAETYALMLAGLGLVGFAVRRRRT